MGSLDFLNKGISTAKEIQKIANAPSIRLEPHCDGREAGIMVENTGEYGAKGIYAKMQASKGKTYPCGPDPIALKFSNKATIDLAGKDKDYLKLCQIRGKKCVLEGVDASLGEGKYLLSVAVFCGNAERKEIKVEIEYKQGKIKTL